MLAKLARFFLLLPLLAAANAAACVFVSYQDAAGKQWALKGFFYDSHLGYAFLNLRNVRKKSVVFSYPASKEWTSKFASVTFNQPGRDFPFGGMNEKGLVMEILWLDETEYPPVEANPAINESQIIQYILDTASNTDEAISLLTTVDLEPVFAPVHYMICDSAGACAAIEFLDKKLVVSKVENDREKFIANSTYQEELSFMRSQPYISDMLTNFKQRGLDLDAAFSNLEELAAGAQWQIAYNMQELKIGFKTIENQNMVQLGFTGQDLDCSTGRSSLALDLNQAKAGAQTFLPYTQSIDRYLLEHIPQAPPRLKNLVLDLAPINHKCLNE